MRLAHLESTVPRVPADPVLHLDAGRAWIELGRLDRAREELMRAVAVDPDTVDALNELAYLDYVAGDLDAGIARLERAMRIRPDDPKLRENLERLERARRSASPPTPLEGP